MAGTPELGFRATVPELLRRDVAQYGDSDFVVGPDSRLTYAEVDHHSRRLAASLLAQGVTKGSRVAFRFVNTPEWLVLWLALARIGAVAMPLSTLYRPAEVRQV